MYVSLMCSNTNKESVGAGMTSGSTTQEEGDLISNIWLCRSMSRYKTTTYIDMYVHVSMYVELVNTPIRACGRITCTCT